MPLRLSWLVTVFAMMVVTGVRGVEAKTPIEIFKQASKSIVFINTFDEKGGLVSSGSGVVIDKEGDVVTNFHVIERAAKLVVVYERKEYAASLKFADRQRDVCSLAVPGLNAVPVTLRKSSEIDIGSRVYAIGFPMGVGLTFSDGIISNYREVAGGRYIQFTAPMSLGSSGGGLFDDQSHLIGIPTYFVTQGQLLNFALPVEWITDLPSRHLALYGDSSAASGDDNAYLKKALALEENEDWIALVELCERWVRAYPQRVRALELLGIAATNIGNLNQAIDAYQKAVRILPDSAQNWLQLGMLYGRVGQLQKQIDAYRIAVRIKPEYATGWYRLAIVYRDAGQYGNVVDALQQVIRIKPGHLSAWLILGYSYERLGQYAKQIEAYSHAIQIDPFSADAYVSLGVAYHSNGHSEAQELEAYQHALLINSQSASALFNLGHYHLGRGNREKGMAYYERLKAVDQKLAGTFFQDVKYRVLPAKDLQ